MVRLFSIAVRVSWLVFQLATTSVANCQPLAPGHAATNPFFEREEEVMLTLSLPLGDVLRDRGATPRPHPATLAYRNAHGAPTELAVQVQVRGNRRPMRQTTRHMPADKSRPEDATTKPAKRLAISSEPSSTRRAFWNQATNSTMNRIRNLT